MNAAPSHLPGPPTWALPQPTTGEVAQWLDTCEADLVHPTEVAERLSRAGWHPTHTNMVVQSYRQRFNEHGLGYSALLVATGIAALAAGSAGHLLVAGLSRPVNRPALAAWLTALFCSLPFAAWAHRWAARVDRDDLVAVWSGPRRTLARVLVWACGIVGIGRLMIYVGELMSALVGASSAGHNSVVAGTLNVSIVVSISLPLGLWAYGFLHRFDDEDPSAPKPRRRAASGR